MTDEIPKVINEKPEEIIEKPKENKEEKYYNAIFMNDIYGYVNI